MRDGDCAVNLHRIKEIEYSGDVRKKYLTRQGGPSYATKVPEVPAIRSSHDKFIISRFDSNSEQLLDIPIIM